MTLLFPDLNVWLALSDGGHSHHAVATLLYEIAQSLGYTMGRTHIRDDIYRPEIHNEFDIIELQTRRLTRDVMAALNAMGALPVRFVPPNGNPPEPTHTIQKAPPTPQEPIAPNRGSNEHTHPQG